MDLCQACRFRTGRHESRERCRNRQTHTSQSRYRTRRPDRRALPSDATNIFLIHAHFSFERGAEMPNLYFPKPDQLSSVKSWRTSVLPNRPTLTCTSLPGRAATEACLHRESPRERDLEDAFCAAELQRTGEWRRKDWRTTMRCRSRSRGSRNRPVPTLIRDPTQVPMRAVGRPVLISGTRELCPTCGPEPPRRTCVACCSS